ncbi:MAG: hypothetical protein P8O03_04400 [Ilumatobacter sp.]|nr:hypothetical protein [Ilumatobacter sp.]
MCDELVGAHDSRNIDDPDAIQAGQTIEIPAGIVVIADLDALVTTVAE